LNLILSKKFKKPLKSGSSHVQNMQTALQKISAHSKLAKTLLPKICHNISLLHGVVKNVGVGNCFLDDEGVMD
jgi:hypothetical protein